MSSKNGYGPKRAILYARVSTDEQARSGYSLAQQMEALREHAACEGYEVMKEITDPGQSGASLERPGMDRVRDLVAAGGISVVLAQDRDRFAREPAYHYLLRREFEEYGCKIRALNDRGDDSPEGELTDGILDQLAKYERAKIAERSRRGKLRKAREGKVIATRAPRYGFRINASRDGYEVNEEEMAVIRRVFRMAGVEGMSLRSIAMTFGREGIPTPKGAKRWDRSFLRNCIRDDVYKPHTFGEVEAMVSPEVAARLDPKVRYGIWWFNRRGLKIKQVSEPSEGGRRYRKTYSWYHKPQEEWIAVPVPDAGMTPGLVEAARAAVEQNRKPSRAGRRFWELTGGIARCKECGLAMNATHSTKAKRGRLYAYDYYRCSTRNKHGREACANSNNPRAEELEGRVWEFVFGLLTDAEQLREDMERMVELERKNLRGDPEREAKVWLDKLAEADRKRSGFQDMAAEGLITFDELREKLAGLEEGRKVAEGELEALEAKRSRLEQLEQDKETVLEAYAAMAPEGLEALTSEERQRLYKILRLEVFVPERGPVEVSFGASADAIGLDECSTKSEGTQRSARTEDR